MLKKSQFAEQIKEFKPKLVSIQDASQIDRLKELIKDAEVQPELVAGKDGINEVGPPPFCIVLPLQGPAVREVCQPSFRASFKNLCKS